MGKVAKFVENPFHIIPSGIESIIQTVAPYVLTAAGQPELAAGYSALNASAHGGNLGDVLKSGVTTYAGSQLGAALGGNSSIFDGLGDTGIGQSVSDLYNGSDLQSGVNSVFGSSGDAAGSVDGGYSNLPSGFSLGGSNIAPGVEQTLAGGAPATTTSGGLLSKALSGGVGGGFSSYALPAVGAINSLYSNQQAQDQLKKATAAANAQLSPYMGTGSAAEGKLSDYLGLGTNPDGSATTAQDILNASPGYQFTLDQGNQALDRQQAAKGNYFSGGALKAAEDYGTGLANQTGQQYLGDLSSAAGTGLNAAGQYGANTTALGTAGANANIQTGNTLSQLLSGVGKRVIGVGTNGQPIYSS